MGKHQINKNPPSRAAVQHGRTPKRSAAIMRFNDKTNQKNTITTNHLQQNCHNLPDCSPPPYVAPLKRSTFHPQEKCTGLSLSVPPSSSYLKMANAPESPHAVIGGLWRRALSLRPPPAGRRLTRRAPLASQAYAHRRTRG